MSKPRLLDLFCGEGGAAMGYHRAGFEVVGIDLSKRALKYYPFESYAIDAFSVFGKDADPNLPHARDFDFIHASPPCQTFSRAKNVHKKFHPDLLTPLRPLLEASGVPYVIENVVLAPMRADLTLCGTMFGLACRRHRLFESSIDLGWPPAACGCEGGAKRGTLYNAHNTAQRRGFMDQHGFTRSVDAMKAAYNVPWMTFDGALEAIPPAYAEYIGARLMRAWEAAA